MVNRLINRIHLPVNIKIALVLLFALCGMIFAAQRTEAVGDPIVMAAGDIADSSGEKITSDLLVAQRNSVDGLNMVLELGDLAYESGTASEIKNLYNPTWGRVKDITKPIVGNHEMKTSSAQPYYDYFFGGKRAGNEYYSFDVGNWHVVALNTEISQASGSAQYNWLKADLAKVSPSKCIMSLGHRPVWTAASRGPNDSFKPLNQLLIAGGADLMLFGHDHNYQRWAKMGTSGPSSTGARNFVLGMGGRGSGTGSGPTSSTAGFERSSGNFGVLKLTLHSDSYDWKFVPAAGRTFTDSGTDRCVNGAGTTPTPTPTPTPGGDSVAPTVAITNPASGATVNGVVAVQGSASDNVGVTRMEFWKDGIKEYDAAGSSFTWNWDTSIQKDNTSHLLLAKAYDAAGNVGQTSFYVNVSFGTTPTPTPAPSPGPTSPISLISSTTAKFDLPKGTSPIPLLKIAKPTGGNIGDMLVLFMSSDYVRVAAPPAGFTLIKEQIKMNNAGTSSAFPDLGIFAYYKVITGSEPAEFPIQMKYETTASAPADGPEANASMMIFRNIDKTNPVVASAVKGETPDLKVTCPSVDGVTNGLLLCGYSLDDPGVFSYPSDLTKVTYFTNGGDTHSATIKKLTTTGPTGDKIVTYPTSSGGNNDFGMGISFRPAGYVAPPAPDSFSVLGIAPNSGSTTGGTEVQINGSGFVAGGSLSVKFNGVAATNVSVFSSTVIKAFTPAASAAGQVSVQVTNGNGQTFTLVGGYTYGAPPAPSTCEVDTSLGMVTSTVSVPAGQEGTYRVWSRISVPDQNANSYILRVDGACQTMGDAVIAPSTWTWVDYRNGSDVNKATVSLAAGTHKVEMIGREVGVKLDRVMFINDGCVPTGTGDNCTALPTSGPDTTAPTVTITNPTDHAAVKGVVPVQIAATDNVKVTKVELWKDGIKEYEGTTAPYTWSWDTSTQKDNTWHQLLAKAFDAAGNVTETSFYVLVSFGTTSTPTSPTPIPTEPAPAPVVGGTLIFSPAGDTEIQLDNPSSNYGSSTEMKVDGSPERRILMKFTVTGLNGRRVLSAKLRLYANNGSDKGGDFRTTSTDWNEKTVTWSTRPGNKSAVIASLGKVAIDTWVEVDLASVITADGTYSLEMASSSTDGAEYYTKEYSTSGKRPQLTVKFE